MRSIARITHPGIVAVCVAAAFGGRAAAQDARFHDDFEATSLDSYWTTQTDSGSITFPSTIQVHGGSQSVQLDTAVTGVSMNVHLQHLFETPTYGVVSVWVYDTGADVKSSNYLMLSASPFSVQTTDYDKGPGVGDTYQYQIQPDSPGVTSIDRTETWHLWKIRSTPTESAIEIDGISVYSGEGGTPFTEVSIAMFAPAGRPEFVVYFDDFAFDSTLASRQSYGDGFPGTNGVPHLLAKSDPILGSTVALDLQNSSDDYTVGLLLVGTTAIDLPTSRGGTLLVAPILSTLLALDPYDTVIAADLPVDELLTGLEIFAQAIEIDAGAARGLSFTPGLKLTLGH